MVLTGRLLVVVLLASLGSLAHAEEGDPRDYSRSAGRPVQRATNPRGSSNRAQRAQYVDRNTYAEEPVGFRASHIEQGSIDRLMGPVPRPASTPRFEGDVRPIQYEYMESQDEPLGFSGSRMQEGMPVDIGEDMISEPIGEMEGSYELDAPAITASSGEWVRSGCWYTQQSAIYLNRSTSVKNSIRLAVNLSLPQILAHHLPSLDVPIDLGYQPGLRSTVGRFLGRDQKNRDHSVEFTFLGLTHWNDAASLSSANGTIVSAIDPSRQIPAFNGANFASYYTSSTMNSYELNYRIDRRLDRDQVVYTRDGTWVRRGTPAPLPSLFGGFRAIVINEQLNYFARSDVPVQIGSYNIYTRNNLFGLQAGTDWFYEHREWRAGVRVKGGMLANWDQQLSLVRIVDGAGNPLIPNRSEDASRHTFGLVGEVSLIGSYLIRPNFAFRATYDMMWVTNLALAQNQLTFNPSTPAGISSLHSLFFSGVGVGFEWIR